MIQRIILTSNYSPWSSYSGGGQRSTHHIAHYLAKAGYDVHVVFTKTWFEKIKVNDSVPYTIHWAKFPGFKSNRKNVFRFLSGISVKQVVKSILVKNCIVHSNGEEGAFINELKKINPFRFIVTPRYPSITQKSGTIYPSLFNALLHLNEAKYVMLHKTLRNADIICPTSEFSVTMFKTSFNLKEKNFYVVYNGVSEEFLNSEHKKNPLKRIIFFGRLSHSKGVDTLLKTIDLVHSYIDEIVFIGRGELEKLVLEKLESKSLKTKISLFHWLKIPDLIEQISDSYIAVLPSREESFGNSIAESMACGTPVITTNIGSIPEIITLPEEGVLLDPEDVQGFANQIIELCSNEPLWNSIAIKGKARVQSAFNWEKSVDSYISIYKSMDTSNMD